MVEKITGAILLVIGFTPLVLLVLNNPDSILGAVKYGLLFGCLPIALGGGFIASAYSK